MPLDIPRPAVSWLRYRFRREMLYSPVLAPAYARLRADTRPFLVQPDTDLLIEGYPRSANTFGVVAFELANGTGARLAHHLHSPVNVERAVRFGVPAIVLVRDPLSAVASHMVRSPWVRPADGLTGYVRFYDRILRLTDSVVVADYRQVTTDFGDVITRVNQRFGTAFAPYQPSPENNAAALNRIDEIERDDSGGVLRVTRVSRPHAARQAHTRQALERLRDPSVSRLVAQATTVYQDLVPSPA